MKKITVSFPYDEEKLNTLKICMEDKNVNLNDELTKSLAGLYNKYVPPQVRAFIEKKTNSEKSSVNKPKG